MITGFEFSEDRSELTHIEYSHCPRSEQTPSQYRYAPVIYDNYMRVHMPSCLFLRYLANREFKSGLTRKSTGDSPRTLQNRADHLVNFLGYLAEKRVLLAELSFDHLRHYVDDMAQGRFSIKEVGKRLNVNTIIPRLQTASMFCEFLSTVGLSSDFKLETIEVSRKVTGISSLAGRSVNGEVLAIGVRTIDKDGALPLTYPLQIQLDKAVTICSAKTSKSWLPLAIQAMYKVGLRRSEIQCSLVYANSGLIQGRFNTAKRDGMTMKIRLIGKNNSERSHVDFPIDLYLKIRALVDSYPREFQSPELPVFLNLTGRGRSKKIAVRTLGDAFHKEFIPILSEVVGFPQILKIHDLRHIFAGDKFLEYLRIQRPMDFDKATRALGGSSFLIQEATERGGAQISSALMKVRRHLGHGQTSTTNIYINWAEALLRLAEKEAEYGN